MASANPIKFFQQARSEIAKVAYPSRREVLLTTSMVMVMAVLMALFFALVDVLIKYGLEGILNVFGT